MLPHFLGWKPNSSKNFLQTNLTIRGEIFLSKIPCFLIESSFPQNLSGNPFISKCFWIFFIETNFSQNVSGNRSLLKQNPLTREFWRNILLLSILIEDKGDIPFLAHIWQNPLHIWHNPLLRGIYFFKEAPKHKDLKCKQIVHERKCSTKTIILKSTYHRDEQYLHLLQRKIMEVLTNILPQEFLVNHHTYIQSEISSNILSSFWLNQKNIS